MANSPFSSPRDWEAPSKHQATLIHCSFLQFPLPRYHSSFRPADFIVSSLKLTPCQRTHGWAVPGFPCPQWSPTLSCLSLNSWEEATTPGSRRDVLLEEGICPEPRSVLDRAPVELPGKGQDCRLPGNLLLGQRLQLKNASGRLQCCLQPGSCGRERPDWLRYYSASSRLSQQQLRSCSPCARSE